MWLNDPNAVLTNGRSVEREIYGLLEWYICECIPYGPHNLGGWWSDGVIHLEIEKTATNTFKLLGVTWIDCHGVAPFEIDVELCPTSDHEFARTIFRIGLLDVGRHPKICNANLAPTRVLEMRPRYNRDWAMAVELTPPKRDVTELIAGPETSESSCQGV